MPSAAPEELAAAIIDSIAGGARFIDLSRSAALYGKKDGAREKGQPLRPHSQRSAPAP
ncbi:MAG: hypothetical protein ACLQVL_21485 [Terriglobia bacterium]